jgi:hypothetical protein
MRKDYYFIFEFISSFIILITSISFFIYNVTVFLFHTYTFTNKHSPWVGNAVGALNHKFFFLFVLYTFLATFLSIIMLMIQFFKCGYQNDDVDYYDNDDDNRNTTMNHNDTLSSSSSSSSLFTTMMNGSHDNHTTTTSSTITNHLTNPNNYLYEYCTSVYSTPIVVLFIISISFLCFTCCMLFEQIDAIETNTSKIARMKMKMGHNVEDIMEYRRVSQDFNEFFGGDCVDVKLHWFLPLKIWFVNERIRDKVLGFEYREEWYGEVYHEGMDDDDEEEEEDFDKVDLELGRRTTKMGMRKEVDTGDVELGDVSKHSSRNGSSTNSPPSLLLSSGGRMTGHGNHEDLNHRRGFKNRNVSEDVVSTPLANLSKKESKHSLKIV